MTPGTIFLDRNFEIEDSTTLAKFIILLDDGSSGCYLVVKTTSKPNHKNNKSGCQKDDALPNFYLPPSTCPEFPKSTWIMLNQYYYDRFPKEKTDKRAEKEFLIRKGELSIHIFADLLDCAIHSPDIDGKHVDLLRPIRKKIGLYLSQKKKTTSLK
ncbi:MAG: hypothetical protein WBD16_04225 [Pyrinomonadaceae bacterium]